VDVNMAVSVENPILPVIFVSSLIASIANASSDSTDIVAKSIMTTSHQLQWLTE